MASFNPSIPTQNAQDFTKDSKPISSYDLKGDESGKIAAEGFGKLFEESVSAIDDWKKSSLAQEAYNRLTPVNDSLTEALQGSMDDIKAKSPSAQPLSLPSNPAGGINVSDVPGADAYASADTPPPPPDTVQAGVDQISRLQQALKLKPELKTYYSGQVAAIQKDMRASNPGYRQYIDSEVSKITGGVDANSHLRDLMTQVASAQENKNHFQQKVEDDLIAIAKEQGDPAAFTAAQNLHNGKITLDQAGAVLSKANTRSWQLKQAEAETNYAIKQREDTTQRSQQIGSQFATDTLHSLFDTVYTGGGALNNESIREHLQNVAEGRAKNDPVQLGQLADMLEARKTESLRIVRARLFQRPTGPDGKPIPGQVSIGVQMGDKADSIIQAAADEYSSQIKLIRNGQMGLAYTLHNNNVARETAAENNIRTDPRVGPIANTLPAMQKLFGSNKEFNEFITKNMMLPETEKMFQGWFQDSAGALISGQTTFDDVLKNGMTVGPKKPGEQKASGITPQTTNQVLNLTKYLGSAGTSPEFKESLAKSAYSEGNSKMMDNFKMDYTDDRGVTHPGKYAVYSRFFSPNITNEMNNLRTKTGTGEQTWQMYTKSAEQQFYKIFRDDMAGMKNLQDTPGLKLKWNPDVGEFKPVYDQMDTGATDAYYGKSKFGKNTFVENTVTRINNGLRNLAYIHKLDGKTGADTTDYVMKILTDSGVDLSKNVQGIPEKFMQELIKGRPLDMSPEEYKKKTGKDR